MTDVRTELTILDPLERHLQSLDISEVAIIDDAYDAPSIENIDGIDEFWDQIVRDDDVQSELKNLGFEVEGPDDIDDTVLEKLWDSIDKLDKLKGPCTQILFEKRYEKRGRLDTFKKHLQELNLNVIELGQAGIPDSSIKLVFVDYYLGSVDDTSSVERSKAIARDIYSQSDRESVKPFIVLMSTLNAGPEQVDEFCHNSGLIGGLFDFTTKDELCDKFKLYLKLKTWIISLPIGYKVQNFLEELEESIDKVSKTFIQDIKTLGLADYAYIQMLSLNDDGHPLGDYIFWLYSSYFGHLLFDKSEVAKYQKALDTTTFSDLPVDPGTPSDVLVSVYNNALFQTEDSNLSHPMAQEGSPEASYPYLHLGDLFVNTKNDDQVWMVINAQCDLEFDPNGSRTFNGAKTILLIPGSLYKLSEPIGNINKPTTELFEYNNDLFRIIWEPKQVMTQEYGKINQWVDDGGHSRILRLRLPFALQIQQSFAADFTRIGLPVTIPVRQRATVQLCCENANGQIEILVESEDAASIYLSRGEEKCKLNEEFLFNLRNEITKAIEHLANRIEATKSRTNANQKTVKKMSGKLRNLETLKDDVDMPLLFRGPFLLPENKKDMKSLGKCLCVVKRDVTAGENYPAEFLPLMLNVNYLPD